jgi:hypothetical protein
VLTLDGDTNLGWYVVHASAFSCILAPWVCFCIYITFFNLNDQQIYIGNMNPCACLVLAIIVCTFSLLIVDKISFH